MGVERQKEKEKEKERREKVNDYSGTIVSERRRWRTHTLGPIDVVIIEVIFQFESIYIPVCLLGRHSLTNARNDTCQGGWVGGRTVIIRLNSVQLQLQFLTVRAATLYEPAKYLYIKHLAQFIIKCILLKSQSYKNET